MFNKKLFEIEDQISNIPDKSLSHGLAEGYGGVVLFYFHLYKYTRQAKYHQKAIKLLEEILDQISETGKLSFCDGVVGVAWLVQFCVNEGFLEDENDSLLRDIDDDIIDWTFSTLESHNLDLFYGSTGSILYLIKRIPHNKGIIKILDEYIAKLAAITQRRGNGLYFPSWDFDNWTSQSNTFNLGIPHGNSSVLYVLNKLNHILVNPMVQTLLKGSLNLLEHEFANKMSNGYFFSQSLNLANHIKEGQSRLAWCNGDLGISLVLLKIATANYDQSLYNWAKLIRDNTLFISKGRHFVRDSSLCHGAAGCAYMYLKLYKATNNLEFHTEAMKWYTSAITDYTIQEGDYGLMEGWSGMGLSILGLLDNRLHSWDQFLLLD